jgi:pectinesterase
MLTVAPIPGNYDAVVATAKFKNLQETIDAAPINATKPYVILIKLGRYRWQPTLIPKKKPSSTS